MAINRNDRTADYINNVVKTFQLVADDGNAATEERLAYTGTPNGVVVLHGANKAAGSAALAVTVTHDKQAGTVNIDGIGMAATLPAAPLVVDIHYKDILQYLGCFTTATRPTPAANDVIYDSDEGAYFRYEGGVWVNKTSNYQEVGVVEDVYSSLSITVSESTSVTPKTVNQAAWDASIYGDATRDVFQNGGTLDLTPFITNPTGTGSIFANITVDATNPVNVNVAINQTTRVLTVNRDTADGDFRVDWGIA